MKSGRFSGNFTEPLRRGSIVAGVLVSVMATAHGAPPAGAIDEDREQRWAALRQARVSCEDSIKEATLRLAAGPSGSSERDRARKEAAGPARAARPGRDPRPARIVLATGAADTVGGGCRSNTECRFGRICQDGRCQERSAHGPCGKDVDCPEDQVCAAAGRCERPAGSSALMTATAPPDLSACRSRCEQERRQCRVDAATELNQCLRAITAEPAYRDCTCPTWPAAKPECRQVCETAFEQGDRCASAFGPRKDTCVAAAPACGDCPS